MFNHDRCLLPSFYSLPPSSLFSISSPVPSFPQPFFPLLSFLFLNSLFSPSSLLALSQFPLLSLPPILSFHFLPSSHSFSSSSRADLCPRTVSGQYCGAENNPERPWCGLSHSPSGKFGGQGLHQTLSILPEEVRPHMLSLSVFQHVHSP